MRNIELKARLHDWPRALAVCAEWEAREGGVIHQLDTYFAVPKGRLKLRESDPGDDYLVYYERPDEAAAKACDYLIHVVDRSIKPVLAAALGVRSVVEKHRTLYLWENVRIHLDRVEGMGEFIEFEAVLCDEYDDTDGYAKVARLREAFGIEAQDVLRTSYLELQERSASPNGVMEWGG